MAPLSTSPKLSVILAILFGKLAKTLAISVTTLIDIDIIHLNSMPIDTSIYG